jgi:hypothetical protein
LNESRSHRRSVVRGLTVCAVLAAAGALAMTLLAGCGPVRLVANTNIPTPLIVKIPVGVALFIPKEFSQYVHEEERWSTKWHVDLGRAQTDGILRLMNSMFEKVVTVDSINAGGQLGPDIRAILEPSIEEYAFVTPRDAGSPFFAVSIKYRVNVYLPDGKLADSWGFTGYGTSPAQGLSSQAPLATATALAMRDAGAKLAVEFREQAIMRGLLPASETADAPAAAPSTSGPATTAPATVATPAATPPPAATPSTPAKPGEPRDAAGPPATESPQEDGQEAPEDKKEEPPPVPQALAGAPLAA